MKYLFFVFLFSIILISCKEKEIKAEKVPQIIQTQKDSVILKEYEERKSIHQQEWEEHQKDKLEVETSETE
jgi:hypothetical protein